MWLIKVFSAICLTAVCAAQDPEQAPPAPSVLQLTSWSDVFPMEKVEFKCNFDADSSDYTFTWSRDGKEIGGSDPNVMLSDDGSLLTITAAGETYSGGYTCKAHDKTTGNNTSATDSRTLKVYANKPQASVSTDSEYGTMFLGESVTLTCKVDGSSGWEFLWYHNSTEISPSNNPYTINLINHSPSGAYHCRAKRGKGPYYTEDSQKVTLQVSDIPKPTLKLHSLWRDLFINESLSFYCEADGPEWEYTWYKNQVELQSNQVVDVDEVDPFLNISHITKDYQGDYSCKVKMESRGVSSGFSNTINVEVYDNLPKPTLRKDPAFNPMYAGELVNFTCNVDVSSDWDIEWLKDGAFFPEVGNTISILLGPLKRGKYSCRASRLETTTTVPSVEISQDVIDKKPTPSMMQNPDDNTVYAGEPVSFTCNVEGSTGWEYFWYKDGKELQNKGSSLTISRATQSDSGRYECMAIRSQTLYATERSDGRDLDILKIPVPTLEAKTPWLDVFPSERVNLSCAIKGSSDWKYVWYKDGQQLQPNRGIPDGSFDADKSTLSIGRASASHRGQYSCSAVLKRRSVTTSVSESLTLSVYEKKPTPSMTQQPDDNMVYSGEPVSFTCKVEVSTGLEYFWYKDGKELQNNGSSLTISGATQSDSGRYECMVIRSQTMPAGERSGGRVLNILEIPVPTLEAKTPWLDVFPSERVILSCAIKGSSDWKYVWYKDGLQLQPNRGIPDGSFDADKSTLSIGRASASHRGQYSCSAVLKRRPVTSSVSDSLTLSVYDTKPKVTIVKNPDHDEIYTGDSVSFTCHINVSSGWEIEWYKANTPLPESGSNHTIAPALTGNSGSYHCLVKRGINGGFSSSSQAADLSVKQRPKPDVTVQTGWSEVFSTDSLVLQCEVKDQLDWNYTWFRNDQLIDEPPSKRHIVTPENDPEQSLYKCRGIRSGRPSYSEKSDELTTKNLLLKRRVLLAISGCILVGIAVIFLGCIILKVVRKPAKDEYKPEEADLFLSMNHLKDSEDAPCPLVEFITDASLKASAKEGDDNSLICIETTTLPITSQDDPDVQTKSQDETETNGGLASFKQ